MQRKPKLTNWGHHSVLVSWLCSQLNLVSTWHSCHLQSHFSFKSTISPSSPREAEIPVSVKEPWKQANWEENTDFYLLCRECLLLGHPLLFFLGAAALLKSFEKKDNKLFLSGFKRCYLQHTRLQASSQVQLLHNNWRGWYCFISIIFPPPGHTPLNNSCGSQESRSKEPQRQFINIFTKKGGNYLERQNIASKVGEWFTRAVSKQFRD